MIKEIMFTLSMSDPHFQCLALNMYHEARNQSWSGRMAVTHVVLNRVKDHRWKDSVCGVVKTAKLNWKGNPLRNKCHFSWYCDGLSDTPKEKVVWERIQMQTTEALALYNSGYDMSAGSNHYHAKNVRPGWSYKYDHVATIDDHLFYQRGPND